MQAEKQRLVQLNGWGSEETNSASWVKVSPRRGDTWALEPASKSVYVICISHGIKNLTMYWLFPACCIVFSAYWQSVNFEFLIHPCCIK